MSFFSWNFIGLFHSCGLVVEMKNLQRSGQAHFIRASSPDSAPPNRFAIWYSLFDAWECAPKCEPAHRLSRMMTMCCQCSYTPIIFLHCESNASFKLLGLSGNPSFQVLLAPRISRGHCFLVVYVFVTHDCQSERGTTRYFFLVVFVRVTRNEQSERKTTRSLQSRGNCIHRLGLDICFQWIQLPL